jgi:aminoglycoside phosphotransferase (APT) family kinase protein
LVLVESKMTREAFDPDQRHALGEEVVDILAALHRVNPDEIGLGDLGRKEAYLSRQLKRWRIQWEKTKTRELATMDEVYDELIAKMPEQRGSGIVHGDYRLGNMLVGSDGRIAAVLDWELCTLGDPLADLGYVLNNWNQPSDKNKASTGAAISPTSAGGFPDRESFIARYEEKTGNDASGVDYYRAFQYWRLAAIVEGVMSRYMKGVMGSAANTDVFRVQIDTMAREALELVRRIR